MLSESDEGMKNEAGSRGPWRASELLALELLLLLTCLLHMRAALLGTAQFQHFRELLDDLAWFEHGAVWHPSGSISGGGPLYAGLHQALRWFGLNISYVQGLHFLLDAGALIAWFLLTRRRLAPSLVWSVGFFVALQGVPKIYLLENSVMLSFTLLPLFAALLWARLGPAETRRWIPAALLLALSLHFSLLSTLVVPVVLVVAWPWPWPSWRGLRAFAGLWGAALALGLAHLLLHEPQAASIPTPQAAAASSLWQQDLQATAATMAAFLGLVVEQYPLMIPGLAVALLPVAWGGRGPGVLAAGLWLLLTLLPMAALQQGNIFDHYHLAVAGPALVFFSGLAVHWLIGVLLRLTGGRLPWRWLLLLVAAGACTLQGDRVIRAARVPPAAATEPGQGACAFWDTPCSASRGRGVFEALASQGIFPDEQDNAVFHGMYRDCLNGAWQWERGPGALGSTSAPASRHMLVMPKSQRIPQAKEVPGTGLALLAGWFPLTNNVEVHDGRLKVQVPGTRAGLLFVELISAVWPGSGKESRWSGGASRWQLQCRRLIPSDDRTAYEGFLVLKVVAGQDRELTIPGEAVVAHGVEPEVLWLPNPGPGPVPPEDESAPEK